MVNARHHRARERPTDARRLANKRAIVQAALDEGDEETLDWLGGTLESTKLTRAREK